VLGFWPDAVLHDEEWEPEHREGVFGAQFTVSDVELELLAEPVHGERGQLAAVGIDLGEVVAGVAVAVAAGREATVVP
jgi:hypothetical protein